jgi:hypothetical protein
MTELTNHWHVQLLDASPGIGPSLEGCDLSLQGCLLLVSVMEGDVGKLRSQTRSVFL